MTLARILGVAAGAASVALLIAVDWVPAALLGAVAFALLSPASASYGRSDGGPEIGCHAGGDGGGGM